MGGGAPPKKTGKKGVKATSSFICFLSSVRYVAIQIYAYITYPRIERVYYRTPFGRPLASCMGRFARRGSLPPCRAPTHSNCAFEREHAAAGSASLIVSTRNMCSLCSTHEVCNISRIYEAPSACWLERYRLHPLQSTALHTAVPMYARPVQRRPCMAGSHQPVPNPPNVRKAACYIVLKWHAWCHTYHSDVAHACACV